jgi:hypothetical protein
MARFDSGVLGYMKGKIGTIVARIRYGEVYIAPKARKYKIKSENLKLAQKVFGRRQRLNTQLRKDKKIQAFWKAIDSSGKNDNTKLMKRNHSFVAYERLLPGCGFTPVCDDKIVVKNVVVEELDIKFKYKLERDNPKILEPPYDVFCIFILDRLFQYTNDGRIRHNVIVADTTFQAIENEPSGTFIPVAVCPDHIIRQQKYLAEKAYIMVAAIKFNELKNKYEWSDTYFEEISDFMPDEDKKKKWDGRILKNNN